MKNIDVRKDQYAFAVCDDNSSFLVDYSSYLQRLMEVHFQMKCMVTQYPDCESLLADIKDGMRFDILFLDLTFEDGKTDGLTLAERLQDYDQWMRIIYVTGDNSAEGRIIGYNPSGYIRKSEFHVKSEDILGRVLRNLKRLYVTAEYYAAERLVKEMALNVNDIVYLDNVKRVVNMLYFSPQDATYMEKRVKGKISDWDTKLQLYSMFVRINQSQIVGIRHVLRVDGNRVIFKEEGLSPMFASDRGLADLIRAMNNMGSRL